MDFCDVAKYTSNPANYPTARERAAQRRESERLERLRREWHDARGVPEDWDPFAEFE